RSWNGLGKTCFATAPETSTSSRWIYQQGLITSSVPAMDLRSSYGVEYQTVLCAWLIETAVSHFRKWAQYKLLDEPWRTFSTWSKGCCAPNFAMNKRMSPWHAFGP